MKPSRFTTITITLAALMLLGPAVTHAAPKDNAQNTWPEVFKLLRDGKDASRPQLLQDGQAVVNVTTGLVRFEVNDVPTLAGPSDSEFGIQDTATGNMVKGTLVCKVSEGAQATLVDTPLVPVADNGDATFTGYLELPEECSSSPQDVAFFIRTTQGGAQGL